MFDGKIISLIARSINGYQYSSLQCRRILGGRNLVRVRDIVVAAIFDFMTVEERSRTSKAVFLIFSVFSGWRFLFSLPAPSPLRLTRPISFSPWEVSTWRFREQIAR